MLHLSASCKYYLYGKPADMRKGFDSLSGLVTSELQMDALSGAVFIFINKKRNQLKLLLWEGDGFALYYKRLEKGCFELPEPGREGSQVSMQQLQFVLQGIQLKSVKFKNRFSLPFSEKTGQLSTFSGV